LAERYNSNTDKLKTLQVLIPIQMKSPIMLKVAFYKLEHFGNT